MKLLLLTIILSVSTIWLPTVHAQPAERSAFQMGKCHEIENPRTRHDCLMRWGGASYKIQAKINNTIFLVLPFVVVATLIFVANKAKKHAGYIGIAVGAAIVFLSVFLGPKSNYASGTTPLQTALLSYGLLIVFHGIIFKLAAIDRFKKPIIFAVVALYMGSMILRSLLINSYV